MRTRRCGTSSWSARVPPERSAAYAAAVGRTPGPAAGEGRTAALQDLRRRHHRPVPRRAAARVRTPAARPGARRHLLPQRAPDPHPPLQADAVRAGQPAGVRRRTGRGGPRGRRRAAHRGHRRPGGTARSGGPGPPHGRRGAQRRRDRAGPRGRRCRRQCQPDRRPCRRQARPGRPRPGGGDPGARLGRRGLGGPGAHRLGPAARQLRLGLPQGRHPHRRCDLGPRRGWRDQALPGGLHRPARARRLRTARLLRPPDPLPRRRLAAVARPGAGVRRRGRPAGAVDPGGHLLRAALRPARGGVGGADRRGARRGGRAAAGAELRLRHQGGAGRGDGGGPQDAHPLRAAARAAARGADRPSGPRGTPSSKITRGSTTLGELVRDHPLAGRALSGVGNS